MIEHNGPANIVTFIDAMRQKDLVDSPVLASFLDKIEKEALDTIRYMQHLENPENIRWSDIKKEVSKKS